MDRIIEVKVGGNYIRKDKKTAGVRGEYEVAILRIEFDESWDEYEKRITFWDARGLNHVFRELDPTKLENHAQSERVFLVPIPEEPMAVAGEMTFVIDGIAEGKKQRSVSDKLEVKDAPMSEDAKPPVEPTPNDVEQMRLELGKINNGILAALTARDQIMNMQVDAETLETGEPAYVNSSWNEYHDAVALHFGLPKGDTGDSGVHIGDEAPSDPDVNVWISSDAMPSILRIKDENGTWHDITAVRGLSAYEIALQNGFEGSEKEWIDKVEAEARMAEEARVVADLSARNALQSAQNAALSEEATYTQSNRAYNQAERAMEYALASGESSSSSLAFSEQAREYAGASGESATTSKSWADESFRQSQAAMEYALSSDESATSSHTFAEEAKASADKAEQYANEMSGVLPNIEAGLSLRPTTEQVKAMHEEDMVENYNIRKIPEGKTIDDLYLEEDYGLYMIDDEVPFAELEFTSRGSQLIVTGGYYWLEGFGDKSTTCQVLLCHDGFKYVIKQRSLQNGKWSAWEDQFATKDDVSKLTYLKDFLKDRPQGLYVDDLDELTYENTGGGVFLWGEPQDGTKQNDMVFVTQGLSPMRDALTTFQMKISLATAYPEPNGYNIKQRYRKHNSQGDFDGWSEWEDIYTTFKKVPHGKSIDDLYGEEYLGCYVGKVTSHWDGAINHSDDFNFLFVNNGYVIEEGIGDVSYEFQTRFVWDGFNYKIQTRKGSGGSWSDWEDCFGTGGGGSEFRLLTEITADGETMYWTVTKDADGNDINVHEVFIEINHADESGYQSIWINGKQEFVRQKVSKGYLEPIYISLQSNLLSGIVGRHSAGVNTTNTVFNSKIVDYKSITEIKTGGYGTSVLPNGTTIKIYAR